uniref:Uncharacterized protein n=1 Tax=Vibrio splendidus TaxID=29497 RepID=A0A0H4A0H4_VIBSP|nr:hypothetical protein [Vibrio splendidus]
MADLQDMKIKFDFPLKTQPTRHLLQTHSAITYLTVKTYRLFSL